LVTSVLCVVMVGCAGDPDVAKRAFVESGDRYAADARHAEAIIEYRNALQQDPMFGIAQLRLAETYWTMGDRVNATPAFVRAADLMPDNADVQVRAGNLLLTGRHFEDAVSRADRALAIAPRHVGALVLRAHGMAGMSRLEDAVAAIEQAIGQNPTRVDIYSSLGAMQLIRGNRELAEAAFRRAVEVAPASAQAQIALANYHLAVGDQVGTEAALRAALRIEPAHVLANRALAYFYVGAGRAAEAEPHLKIVAEASSGAAGQMGLAEYYLAQQRTPEARQWFERVASGRGRLAAAARLRLATLDFTAGNAAEATRRVSEVLAGDPSNTRALTARAELLAASGDLEGALASARRAVEGDRQSAPAQFALGKVYLLRRDSAEALTAFTTAIQIDPRLVPARVELAGLHLAAGRIDEAEQVTQTALAMVPTATDARLMMARVHLARNNPSRAEPILRDLERQLPASPAVATAVAMLELRRNQAAAARRALERAIAHDPASLDALRLLTDLDLRERHPEAARARLAAAMRAVPDDAGVTLLAAGVALALGDTDEAERLARAGLETDADAIEAYAVLGRVYLRTNRLAEATTEFARLADRQPRNVSVHTTVGMLHQMQGQIDEARAAFERALDLDGNATVAANNLAWIHAEHGGDLNVALKLARTARTAMPDHPAVADTFGWVLHKTGQSGQAIVPLEQAVAAEPRNASYHYHLGVAHAANDDPARARAALQRAASLDPSGPGPAALQALARGAALP
jgi:tetratricopeptide (TPR) repeat protein